MTASRYAERAAKVIREAINGDGPPPSQAARASAISAIERAIEARRRRSRLRVLGAGIGVAAAAAAMIFGVTRVLWHDAHAADQQAAAAQAAPSMLAHPLGDATVTPENGAPAVVREGDVISQGSHLTTPAGSRVVLSYPSGTQLTLRGGGDMSVVEDGKNRIYALGHGTLDLSVAKLTASERLIVKTKDAEVEVRGTRFHVEVVDPATSCDHASATRVMVDEGVVVVRNAGVEARITAGQSWPACSATQGSLTPTQGAQMQLAAGTQQATRDDAQQTSSGASGASGANANANANANAGAGARPPTATEEASPSALKEANDIFQDGVDKQNRGDTAGAAHAFEHYLQKHPNAQLAESASARRFRILRASDPARAKSAARDYLARWPHGFAHEDAESVLKDSP